MGMREDFGGRKYTSAKLETRSAWRYGKFTARARLQHGDARRLRRQEVHVGEA